jgi:heme-degrading monooxygenase HmoA
MFARMTIMMFQPDKIEEAVEIYKKSVVPAAKKQKGFRGACLLRDDQAGKGISVTFWNTKKNAEDNEANLYYQEQLAKFLPLFTGPPLATKEGYDVAVHILKDKSTSRPAKKR